MRILRRFFFFYLFLFAFCSRFARSTPQEADIVLIGSGIMSATLGSLLLELNPKFKVIVLERLESVACESSNAWNNAGTGHAGLCELNYTPLDTQGQIRLDQALEVMEAFEVSKQFWAYLVQAKQLGDPSQFIHSVPHMSWAKGAEDVQFLKTRVEALKQHHLFEGMEYTDDPATLKSWLPLMMEGRDLSLPLAASRSLLGTDVDFGRLTQMMLARISKQYGAKILLGREVQKLSQGLDGLWELSVVNRKTGWLEAAPIKAKFVFIGAGGGALHLLQSANVPEAQGYAGFPVGGEFLITQNPKLINQHFAKVYGRAQIGAPPMSVPHLDTRIIDGKQALIFGPFAEFTTKFLKEGSIFDWFRSLRSRNLLSMLEVAFQNQSLVTYLMNQATQRDSERLLALREFIPNAQLEDWELGSAGKRVQVIRDSRLHFGTEVVTTQDGTLAALVGASPGASTAVTEMIKVIARSFKTQMQVGGGWQAKLSNMIPSFNHHLSTDPVLTQSVRLWTQSVLGLNGCAQNLVGSNS